MTGPYDGMYDPDALPVGPTFIKKPEGHALFNRARAEHYLSNRVEGHDMRHEESWRKLRAQYYGNVKIIDDAIGRMVQALEETGQMENTIFAVTSDHGEMAGDHAMFEKRAFYEESARVPMLLSVPWLTQIAKAHRRRLWTRGPHRHPVGTRQSAPNPPGPPVCRRLNRRCRPARPHRIHGMERHWRPQPGQPQNQPHGHLALALRRNRRPMETQLMCRRPVRIIRPEQRPL